MNRPKFSFLFFLLALPFFLTAQESGETSVLEICRQWNGLQMQIRDNLLPRESAKGKMAELHKKLLATIQWKLEVTDPVTFPVEGFSCDDIGGKSKGFSARGYDFYAGNNHQGHPALDIFIDDENLDGKSDATKRPVRVLAFSGGLVVVANSGWPKGSEIRGGNYLGIYDPTKDQFIYYAHLGELYVSLGDRVSPGQPLATIGRTGKNAYPRRSPTHLHFVILRYDNGRMTPVNPYPLLCASGMNRHSQQRGAAFDRALMPPYPADSLANRFPLLPGYDRVPAETGSFADFLRRLKMKPGHPQVRLYDGREKNRSDVHAGVVDMEIGNRDLQQCADALIRLRAEYLWERRATERVRFHFVSGFEATWPRWREGWRPRVQGTRVIEEKSAPPSFDHASFRLFLDKVFEFANTWSLVRDTDTVSRLAEMSIGDIFIQGGFPGHAVIVGDMGVDYSGGRVFLLLQSYMPAQEIHVLKNPSNGSPWYPIDFGEKLVTPEWVFASADLRRFRD